MISAVASITPAAISNSLSGARLPGRLLKSRIKMHWRFISRINAVVLLGSLFRRRDLFDLGLYNGQRACTRTNKE